MEIQSSTLRSKLIRINSASRNKNPAYGYTSSRFRLDFNMNIPDLIKVHSMVLKSCSIPNTSYNINDYNRKFSFIAGPDSHSITIQVGNYTISELIAELTAAPIAVFYGLEINVEFPSGKLNFTATSPISLIPYESGNDMASTLGIFTASGPITSWTADSLPNLTGLQNVYIVSQTLSGGTGLIDATFNQLPVFAHINMTVPFGQYQHYTTGEEQSDEIFFPADRTIGELDVALYNDRGQLVNLQGLEWSMIVKIYYHVTSQS